MTTQAELDALAASLREAKETIQRFGRSTGNHATITVTAGGFGVWLTTTAAAVMLAVNVLLILIYVGDKQAVAKSISEIKSDVSKTQDYLNAIYMQAPQLRPKQEK